MLRRNRWSKLIFLHTNTSSGKLKVISIIFGEQGQKWAKSFYFTGLYKLLCLKNEYVN